MEKLFKIFVIVLLLLNFFLAMIILSSMNDIEDSLETFIHNTSLQGNNGRFQGIEKPNYNGGSSIIIIDTQTGESRQQ